MTPIKGVVVGHGRPGGGADRRGRADQRRRTAAWSPISNTDCDRGTLEERIIAAATPGPALVFIDMPSGSCHFAAMRRIQSMPDVRVVTGVNLAMLLEFVFHRDGDVDEVADAHCRGRRARGRGPLMPLRALPGGRPAGARPGRIGWGRPLAARFIVLVDDEVRAERLGAGPLPHGGARRRARSSSRARPRRSRTCADGRPTRGRASCSPPTSPRWPRCTTRCRRWSTRSISAACTIGPGRVERLRYIYLTDGDEALLRRLGARRRRDQRAGPADRGRRRPGGAAAMISSPAGARRYAGSGAPSSASTW